MQRARATGPIGSAGRFPLAAALALCLTIAMPGAPAAQTGAAPEDRLDALLATMLRVAGLYRDSALEFVARERIDWYQPRRGRPPRRRATLSLDYFYVARDDASGVRLADFRTKPDDESGQPLDPLRSGLPGYLSRPYSWIFVFLPEQRSLYDFTYEGAGEALGRDAEVVAFEPRGPAFRKDLDDAFGRIWIDVETRTPLRVEAVRSDAVLGITYGAISAAWRSESDPEVYYPFHHITVEYGTEKNGLRFPSRAALGIGYERRSELGAAGYRDIALALREEGLTRPVALVRHRFTDYRFFRVRTEEEIVEIINDG